MSWVPITNAFNLSSFVNCAEVAGGITHAAYSGRFDVTLKNGVTAPASFPIRLVFVSGSAQDQSGFLYDFAIRFGGWYTPQLQLKLYNAASGTLLTDSLAVSVEWSYNMSGPAGDVVFLLEIDDFTFTIPNTEHVVTATATDTLALSSSVLCDYFFPVRYLSDGFVLLSAARGQPTYRLLDALRLQPTPSTTLELSITLTERLALTDAIGFIANLLASDGLTFTDDATADITRLLLLAETLAMTSGVGATLEIARRLAEQLAVVDLVSATRTMTLEEALALSDSVTKRLNALLTAEETLLLAEKIESSLVVIANEDLHLGDTLASTLEVVLRANDGIVFIGTLPLQDGDYQAWVMNTDTTGTSSYTNFPMESLFTYKGIPYGLTSTGLYRLEGADDDGTNIDALIATGDLNLGTLIEKNATHAYLYLTQNGDILLRTITSRQGRRTETYYQVADRTTESDDDVSYRKVKLGMGTKGTWWRFELASVDGASFDLNGAEVRYVALTRRGSWR